MRPSWDCYLLNIARMAATRATCPRLQVGCVLATSDHRIISTGFNGSPPGQSHCTEIGCEAKPGRTGCYRTTHAERNAIVWALDNYPKLLPGCTAYVTHSPCQRCAETLAMAEVSRVVYGMAYRDTSPLQYLERLGIVVSHLET
jgi:dCMP deaminase